MSGKEQQAWFCYSHRCGCRICIHWVFLKDFGVGLWEGPCTVSCGVGKAKSDCEVQESFPQTGSSAQKRALGPCWSCSHLFIPYPLDASSCPPLPHCVPQPSGCTAVTAKSPFPVTDAAVPTAPSIPVPSSGPTADDPLCLNDVAHLWLQDALAQPHCRSVSLQGWIYQHRDVLQVAWATGTCKSEREPAKHFRLC